MQGRIRKLLFLRIEAHGWSSHPDQVSFCPGTTRINLAMGIELKVTPFVLCSLVLCLETEIICEFTMPADCYWVLLVSSSGEESSHCCCRRRKCHCAAQGSTPFPLCRKIGSSGVSCSVLLSRALLCLQPGEEPLWSPVQLHILSKVLCRSPSFLDFCEDCIPSFHHLICCLDILCWNSAVRRWHLTLS